jgi:hypothetical protein
VVHVLAEDEHDEEWVIDEFGIGIGNLSSQSLRLALGMVGDGSLVLLINF